jgi:hypothetical protein
MTFSKTDLTPGEKKYLKRQIRNAHNYVYFTIANLVVAIGLSSYYILANKMFSGSNFVLIIVLLLAARANLKQHKDAKLFIKLQEQEVHDREH